MSGSPQRQTREDWQRHRLPANLAGLSFLDVGCWEGVLCSEAARRGASRVLGVDYCTSPELTANRAHDGFDFMQMDVASETFLALPQFDVVHSAGVLYHLANPVAFLFRLRKLTRIGGVLHLVTSVFYEESGLPLLLYHPGNSLDDNLSNWFTPNPLCLRLLVQEAGFDVTGVTTPEGEERWGPVGRALIIARASNRTSAKLLPRRWSYMPDSEHAGSRAFAVNGAPAAPPG